MSTIWNWAAARDEVASGANPAKGVARLPERANDRFLSSDEFRRLGEALSKAETEGLPYEVNEQGPNAKHAPKPENRKRVIDTYAAAAIRLLILTGARLREILHARWDSVDLRAGFHFCPIPRPAENRSTLDSAMLSILTGLPRVEGNPYIIAASTANKRRADLKNPWRTLTEAAGLNGLRIHDFRHSFASVGAGESLGLAIIGKLLGHTQPSTTARYAHLDANPMRRSVETIADMITTAMNGPVGHARPSVDSQALQAFAGRQPGPVPGGPLVGDCPRIGCGEPSRARCGQPLPGDLVRFR